MNNKGSAKNILFGIEAKVIGRTGPRVSDRVMFEAFSPKELSVEQITELQMELGYHPAGYDGPWGINKQQCSGGYNYKWSCAASCD